MPCNNCEVLVPGKKIKVDSNSKCIVCGVRVKPILVDFYGGYDLKMGDPTGTPKYLQNLEAKLDKIIKHLGIEETK